MIQLLLIFTLNFNKCDSTTNNLDTIVVHDQKIMKELKCLWIKYPLPNVKIPVIIYKPKQIVNN